jgi:antitoxin ParD1/3/4
MTISLTKKAQSYIDAAVASGQYASAEAVLEAGLALLADRDRKLHWLRDKVQQSIAEGGSHTLDEVLAEVDSDLDAWELQQSQVGKS